MEARRILSAAQFLELTTQLRERSPIMSNVIGSVATTVAEGSRSYDEEFWWVVEDHEEPVGFAMRTVPHALFFGPSAPGAAAAIAAAVLAADPTCPNVNGPKEEVGEFLVALRALGDERQAVSTLREFAQSIEELSVPNVEGRARIATVDDLELVIGWGHQFAIDAHVPLWSDDSLRNSIDSKSLYLWELDGRPVSMAGHAVPVLTPSESVARVGPVFTPHELRGRGYAAAVTAAITQHLMDLGHHVMLHTDAANPTSNGVYARLGYHVVGELTRFDLVAS